MLFPTFQFAVFFGLVFLVAWRLIPWPSLWRFFLLLAGVVFYAAWDASFLPLLVCVAGVNHLLGQHLARRPSRTALGLAIGLNLLVLGAFKYTGFVSSNLNAVLALLPVQARVPLVQPPLPLGLSFVVFQAISYVVDVYRRQLRPCSFPDLLLYLTFFPHVVAGPIVRASEFLPQIQRTPDPSALEAGRAFWLISCGMWKKVVLASYLASQAVDPVFGAPSLQPVGNRLVALYAYALQIYFDFSGYTDIAIGVALLLGVRFPQNFDSPYRAVTVQEFWRRWHMTLSRWLRDFLYIPLGGSQGGTLATYRNLLLTMLLGGLWHGPSWNFVLWGLLHGLALALERVYEQHRGPASATQGPLARALRTVVTFHFVCLCWIFFRAESFSMALEFFAPTANARAASVCQPTLVLLMVSGLAVQFAPPAWETRLVAWLSAQRPLVLGLGLGVALALITLLGPPGVAPFIYFQF